jgi:hypothetical protein
MTPGAAFPAMKNLARLFLGNRGVQRKYAPRLLGILPYQWNKFCRNMRKTETNLQVYFERGDGIW